MINDIYSQIIGLKMVSSQFAVFQDGTKPKEIKRSWRDRLFSLPWRPFKKTRTIQVPNMKPAIYRAGDQIIYHPSLESEILAAIKG